MKITPEKLAAKAIRELQAVGDPQVAAGARAYFKAYESVSFYGVKAPQTRKIAKGLAAQVRGEWELKEAIAFCDLLICKPELEAKNVGILVLSEFRKRFTKAMLKPIEGWLAKNHCADWASTDSLCASVLAPMVATFPEIIPTLKRWTAKRNLWLRRASAVPLTYSARRGQHLDEIYEIAALLLPYPEDLIHKANGWLLREAGEADAPRLEAFLLAHGPRLPRTTLRYAIEKFPPAKRKLLLAQTKAG